ncbi:MAG: hypothetical protein OXC01_16445 [Immundisolibacterales bacterium]|nr:hypothetical protein [Immundisolibacterales bacterium]
MSDPDSSGGAPSGSVERSRAGRHGSGRVALGSTRDPHGDPLRTVAGEVVAGLLRSLSMG